MLKSPSRPALDLMAGLLLRRWQGLWASGEQPGARAGGAATQQAWPEAGEGMGRRGGSLEGGRLSSWLHPLPALPSPHPPNPFPLTHRTALIITRVRAHTHTHTHTHTRTEQPRLKHCPQHLC